MGKRADVVAGFLIATKTSRSERRGGLAAEELVTNWGMEAGPGHDLAGCFGRYIGHDDDRHILTVAGSRAGVIQEREVFVSEKRFPPIGQSFCATKTQLKPNRDIAPRPGHLRVYAGPHNRSSSVLL
jgi:hypothetical protein